MMKKILTLVLFMLAISPLFGQNAYTVTKNGNMAKLSATEGYTLEYRIYDINSDPNVNGGQNSPSKQATIAQEETRGPERQIQWNVSTQVIDIRYIDESGNWTPWTSPEIE